MKLVTTTEALSTKCGLKESISIIKKAGFDAIDMSLFEMANDDNIFNRDDYMEYTEEILTTAKQNNISFVQAHAPFPVTSFDDNFCDIMLKRVVRSMEIASYLGAKIIVVHPPKHIPHTFNNTNLIKETTNEFYRKLIPYCKKYNIKIATENMFDFDPKRNCLSESVNSRPQTFIDTVDAVDSEYLGACVDVGHCGLVGENAADMIRALGSRVLCLHIHDNDYINDLHNMPYLNNMDWDEIIGALNDINYKGNFTFEVFSYINAFPAELAYDAEVLLEKVGRHLMNKLKNS